MSIDKNIKLLSWFNFLNNFRLYYPVMIIYFTNVSGSFALGMSIFSISMISSSLAEIPTGIYSDIIGRKKTLVWGSVLSFLSVIFYATANSYYILAIGAITEGIAFSFFSGNNDALLMDILSENKQKAEYANFYGKVKSYIYWSASAIAIIGSVLAYISFKMTMFLTLIPLFVAILVALKIKEPKNAFKNKSSNIYSHLRKAFYLFKTNYRLKMLSLSKIIGFARGESSYQFQAAFINTLWPLWAIGFAKLLSNIIAALSSHFAGTVIKKIGAYKTLFLGLFYSLFANIISLIYPTVLSPIILSSTAISHGTNSAASSQLLQKEYSDSQRSTMDSLNSLAGSILYATISLFLGATADLLGPSKALLIIQALGFISIFFIWKAFKRK